MLPLGVADGDALALWRWIVVQQDDLDRRSAAWRETLEVSKLSTEKRERIEHLVSFAESYAAAVSVAGVGDAWKIWDRFVGVARRALLNEQPSLLNMVLRTSMRFDELVPGDPTANANLGHHCGRGELEARDNVIRHLRSAVAAWTDRWPGRPKRPVQLGSDGLSILRPLMRLFPDEAEVYKAWNRLLRVESAFLAAHPTERQRLFRARIDEGRNGVKTTYADEITAEVLGCVVDAVQVSRIARARG